MGPVLNIAQVFGVFPVTGVRSSSPSKLQFKTFSFITIYSGFVAMMAFFMASISVIYMFRTLNADTVHKKGKCNSLLLILCRIF